MTRNRVSKEYPCYYFNGLIFFFPRWIFLSTSFEKQQKTGDKMKNTFFAPFRT